MLMARTLAPSATIEAALRGAECVVAITPYASDDVRANATIILPAAVFAETSGTWVNVEGRWQSVAGAADLQTLLAGVRRQMLHAWRLEIAHPRTGKRMAFESPLPEDMEQLVAALESRSRKPEG